MRVGLSTAAGPELELRELLEACGRRGLASLELVAGHRHGLTTRPDRFQAATIVSGARDTGVAVAAIAFSSWNEGAESATATLSGAIGVPILLPYGGQSSREITAVARQFRDESGRALLLFGTDAIGHRQAVDAVNDAARHEALGIAWEFDPTRDEPDALAAAVGEVGARVEYIRIRGGGPETVQQTGMGIGSVMGRLTLGGFAGPLILAPSRASYHQAWLAWLGRRGATGCGSKQSDTSLVVLS
jgi:hypothetical protein